LVKVLVVIVKWFKFVKLVEIKAMIQILDMICKYAATRVLANFRIFCVCHLKKYCTSKEPNLLNGWHEIWFRWDNFLLDFEPFAVKGERLMANLTLNLISKMKYHRGISIPSLFTSGAYLEKSLKFPSPHLASIFFKFNLTFFKWAITSLTLLPPLFFLRNGQLGTNESFV